MSIRVHHEGVIVVDTPVQVPLIDEQLGVALVSIVYGGGFSYELAILSYRCNGWPGWWSPYSSRWSSSRWSSSGIPSSRIPSFRRIVLCHLNRWEIWYSPDFSAWGVSLVRSHCSVECCFIIYDIDRSSYSMAHVLVYFPNFFSDGFCHHSHRWEDVNGLS